MVFLQARNYIGFLMANQANAGEFDFNQKTKLELLNLLRVYQKAIDINLISSITDEKGTILYVNDKFCEISKYQREELIGKTHQIINSGAHPRMFFEELWRTIRAGKSWNGEIKNKAKDGSMYWVETVILPITDATGKVEQYLSLRFPITDKKKAEQQAQEYTLSLKDMLFATSHYIRSPLATCMGLVNYIESKPEMNADEMRLLLGHVKTTATELNNFITDLARSMHELDKKYQEDTNTQA